MYKIYHKLWCDPQDYTKQFLRIMKLLFILMTTCLMQVSAFTYAQRITLSEKNATLVSVFEKISKQSGVDFLVTNELLAGAKTISIQVKNKELTEVLDRIFEGQPLSYILKDKAVIVKRKEPSLLDKLNAVISNTLVIQSAAKDLRGRVLDQDGKPLPNASIRIKGKNTVTNTNADGEFELKGIDEDAVLLVSYVGFKTLEIVLKDAVMPLEIKLNVATGELEEVKVVYNTGYQELNKERATGSFVHIDNELYNRIPGGTVLDKIVDVVPGLLYRSRVGSGPLDKIQIRGVSTINASKNPLLVVDNFIYDGDINALNPNDIESVTVLKDAAAASIWGVRAGNGVIVLTTKKGRYNQKLSVSYTSNISITAKPNLDYFPAIPSIDIVALEKRRFESGFYNTLLNNTTVYPSVPMAVEILAKKRAGTLSASEADTQLALLENHDVRDDINKYLKQSAIAQQHALSISGGSGKHSYHGSLGYDRGRPNDLNIINDRLYMRFSNLWRPLKNLQLNTEISWNGANENNKNAGGYSLRTPYERLADEQGNPLAVPSGYRIQYVDTVQYKGLLDWHYRPLDEARNGNKVSHNYDTRFVTGLSYKILSGLNASVNYQWQKTLFERIDIRDMSLFTTRDLINKYVTRNATTGLTVYPIPLGSIYGQSNGNQTSWNFRGQLTFRKDWAKHAVSAITGIEFRENSAKGTNFPGQPGYNAQTNTFTLMQFGTWTTRPNGSIGTIGPGLTNLTGSLNRNGSYYTNGSYTYDGKYTVSGSARVDQSNFFGVKANDRIVPLWSAGVSWDIAKEKFYAIDLISALKIRATYGYNGNVNAGMSPFATAIYNNPGSPIFVPFATLQTAPNPQLRWEKVRNVNLGIDFVFKNNRINGSIDLYQKRGIDLISPITVDPTSGFETYTGNLSSIKGKGMDLSLHTINLRGALNWETNFIFSYNTHIVTAYSVVARTDAGTYAAGSGILIGQPVDKLYTYKWAGLDPTTGDALLYINNQVRSSKDYLKAKLEDLVPFGRTTPPISGSFCNEVNWQNIKLSFSINYRFGSFFKRPTFGGSITTNGGWEHRDYLKAWKVPGDELYTNVPGFLDSPDSRYSVYTQSDILVEKGDHVRLQDIRLSYGLNQNSFKRLPFSNISFYVYVSNLGILWRANKLGIDPDVTGFGQYPNPRSISFGINFNL